MSESITPISILDCSADELVEAFLCTPIQDRHVQDTKHKWEPWLDQLIASRSDIRDESSHWDWQTKIPQFQGLLGFPTYAVECEGETQGLMVLSTLESCRIPEQHGKPLIYVEYVVVAPWNRKSLTDERRYGAIGSMLIAAAIQISQDEDFDGRIGLHSLPQSEGWYRDEIGMTDLGVDSKKMRYFEMTTEQANAFLVKGT